MDINYYNGIDEFIRHAYEHGIEPYSFAYWELKFGIVPYKTPGNRAKKVWYKFKKSGMSPDEYINSKLSFNTNIPENSRSIEYSSDSAYFTGVSETCLTSLDDLLKFTKVDLDIWECVWHREKSYDVTMKLKKIGQDGKSYHVPHKRTNYAVEARFKKLPVPISKLKTVVQDIISGITPINKSVTLAIGDEAVVVLSDFHFGAKITDLLRTKDFSIQRLEQYLHTVAEDINRRGYSSVTLVMLGDYFESLSGFNHINSLQNMEADGYGSSIFKMAVVILRNFISKIFNVSHIYMVSGNHDRITPDKNMDRLGSGGEMLAFALSLSFNDTIPITYHPYLISVEINGIHYVNMHGNFGMSNKDPAKILFEHGNPKKYNIILVGHDHSRKTIKVQKREYVAYDEISVVNTDMLNYRKIVVPPIFTGNLFSELLGYDTLGGYLIIQNNGKGLPIVTDIPL